MAQILIEENFRHIDGLDMEALLNVFRAQGITAEPTQRQTPHRGTGWVLVLHMLGNQAVHSVVESAVRAVVDDIRELYRIKRNGVGEDQHRTPPYRIDIYGSDERVMASVEVPDTAPSGEARMAG